jgi:hypothetical protein
MAGGVPAHDRVQFRTAVSDITPNMKSIALPLRFGRRSTLSDPSSLRMEVCPPSLRHAPSSAWQRLVFWLLAPAPHEAAPPIDRLPGVRGDFLATVADIDSRQADALRNRIASARSLRELWHLRSDVFQLIGQQYSQSEAERRLALLARHFPTHAPRSQFGPF